MTGWHTPTDFVAGTVVTEAMLDDTSSLLTTGVMRPIAETVLAANAGSIDFSSIPATFRHLMLILSARGDAGGNAVMRFNNDSGANYQWQWMQAAGTALTAGESLSATSTFIGNITTSSSPAGAVGAYTIWLPNYSGTTLHKGVTVFGGNRNASTTGGLPIVGSAGHWLSAAAINRVTILPASSNFVAGTICTLYGVPNPG